jgi:hypothetical protein
MAMTKAEVRRAFREAMAADYADVPAKDALNHTFSPEFCAKMDALIAEQKRGSWRLLSRQTRRALVVAAILAASLLLVACTPRLREAGSEFVVTVYETFVRFTSDSADGQSRTEIETIYEFDPEPEGFEMVSREQGNPYSVETVYIDSSGNSIVLHQVVPTGSFGSTDSESANSSTKTILETDVWFSSADDIQTATFFYDGYRLVIRYFGETTQTEFECIVESFLSTD